MTSPPSPRHAATVVLLRDRPEQGPEIFMVKRHKKSGFMASAYVYPGGKLDAQDCTAATAKHCEGVDASQAAALMAPKGGRLEDDLLLTPAQCLGLFVAAIREVFEEAGVLLARRGEGRPLSFEEPETARRFDSHRRQLHEGTLSMTEMARREDLVYSLDRLQYFAHWITPTVEKRRFNTRFFMARSPPGQEPLHDKTETVDSAWLTPEQALEAYNAGEIQLAPPTMRTLEEMLGAPSSEALISAATRSRPVTILPRFETIDGEMTILLPGDPLYPCRDGVEGPTRVVMSQGRWWSRSG